jgi:hypothetical protein
MGEAKRRSELRSPTAASSIESFIDDLREAMQFFDTDPTMVKLKQSGQLPPQNDATIDLCRSIIAAYDTVKKE